MVSQEEYDYAAFKCAFCKILNPAKKLRPIAPRISSQKVGISHQNNPLFSESETEKKQHRSASESSSSKPWLQLLPIFI